MTKDKDAQRLGSLGGKARAAALTDEERYAIASNAAQAYWDSLTKEERSAVMRERAKKRKKKAP